jgi:ubiquinol-cytochrome c reductase cytochrome b subunit
MNLPDRIGWASYLRPFLLKPLPERTRWSATLGTVTLLLLVLMGFSGAILALDYSPTPTSARLSIEYLAQQAPMGAVLSGVHYWGAGILVLIAFLHLLDNFFSGSYKRPRELTWATGVFLLLLILGAGFTGSLLPWDARSHWAAIVATNILKGIPLLGPALARILLGGSSLGAPALTRFYAVHILFLPALIAAFAVTHIYLVRLHGLAGPVEGAGTKIAEREGQRATESPVYRLYPEHLFRCLIVFAVLLLVIVALTRFYPVPREWMAGAPELDSSPRPDWYFLWFFQLLTYFPGSWERVGSLLLPIAGLALLLLLPFFDTRPRSAVLERPLALAVGATGLVALVWLTWMGAERARPYGQCIPLPERSLNAAEERGLALYAGLECAYCHQIEGRGGRRTGPDLANPGAKGRGLPEVMEELQNPQGAGLSAAMPRYDLPPSEVHDLAQFILALEFRNSRMRLVKREDIPGPKVNGQPATPR